MKKMLQTAVLAALSFAAMVASAAKEFAYGVAEYGYHVTTVFMHSQGLILGTYKLTLTDLQNVTPGNVAILKMPVGQGAPTYDLIRLQLSGGALPSHIEYVRGKIDGRIFMDEGTGSELQDRDDFRGIFSEAGFVNIDFTEPKARNGAAEQLVAAVPGQLCKSLQFEIKLAAGFPALGRIEASCNYRPPTNNAYIRKMFAFPQAFSAAGTDAAPNILYLPVQEAGSQVKRIWVKETTAGNITGAQIRIGNAVVHEVSRAKLEHDQKRNGLVPQAGLFVLDFIEDGNLAGLLDTRNVPGVELRLTTTAGESLKAYMEVLDPIGRL